LNLCERIDELYQNNASQLARDVVAEEQLTSTNQVLSALERYWSNYISYSR
jgi:hypothetical protein